MPVPPVGHVLLTHPVKLPGGVYIPDLARRMHELPPPGVPIDVAGPDADVVVKFLVDRGRLARSLSDVPNDGSAPERPEVRLWRADPWVESRPLPMNSRVLDFGCGSGRDAVYLASQGFDVTAFDILPDAVEKGKDLEARYGNGAPIHWTSSPPDGLFDLVLLLRCGRRELVDQAVAYVKPGGNLWTSLKTQLVDDRLTDAASLIDPGTDWTRIDVAR